MSGATSGEQPLSMNSIDEYQAEIAYRREQMLHSRRPLINWRWIRGH